MHQGSSDGEPLLFEFSLDSQKALGLVMSRFQGQILVEKDFQSQRCGIEFEALSEKRDPPESCPLFHLPKTNTARFKKTFELIEQFRGKTLTVLKSVFEGFFNFLKLC